MILRRSCEEDDEATPGPVELRADVGQRESPRARQGVSTPPAGPAWQGPVKELCVHVWPPLTRTVGVDVSLWLCLANSALTADTPNLSKHPSQAECQH